SRNTRRKPAITTRIASGSTSCSNRPCFRTGILRDKTTPIGYPSERGRFFARFRSLFARVGTLGGVGFEPLQLHVHLKKHVTQLGPPVRFAWRDIKMRRHAVALERPIHFNRLRFRHTWIVLANQENRGCRYF